MTTLLRTDIPVPTAPVLSTSRYVWLIVRAWTIRLSGRLARRGVWAGRLLLTWAKVIRLGLVWRSACGEVGLAELRKTIDKETGAMTVRVYRVPRLSHLRITQHGWTQRVRIRAGQTLHDYVAASPALRHAARVQTFKVVELPDRPGFLEMRVLRRDPLTHVTDRPRPLGPAQMAVGTIENGDPMLVDFDRDPHLLMCGGTGSGKSKLLAALLAALAETPALIQVWDLKWGIEAHPWQPRLTSVATTQPEVHASAVQILEHAGRRAELFKSLGVTSISEADALGVRLRRVVLVVDEVAEVALDHGHKDDNGAKLIDVLLPEVLSIVQRVRAFGIHVVLCGQRFGSDLGPKITAIRAQIPGRVCLGVNDVETARMVLPGFGPEVHEAVMGINRPGLAVVADGQHWHYGRSAYLTPPEIRAIAQATSGNALSWDELEVADKQAITDWERR